MTNTPETIDEVLALYMPIHPDHAKDAKATKAALSAMVNRIIGEDGDVTGYMRPQGYMSVDLTQQYYNTLRAEQRKRATALGFTVNKEGK